MPGVYLLHDIAVTLAALGRGGAPRAPGAVSVTADNQAVLDVFPLTPYEHLTFGGFRGEVWCAPGEAPRLAEEVRRRQGGTGELALILGAGNANCVVVGDIANRCLADGAACVVKFNPVNEYIGPFVEKAFAPLVARGALRFVYGGAEAGKQLCEHALVESVHITGSDRTFDAIVWGPGAPKVGAPPFSKAITAELGCVTPVVVVPGDAPWSPAELAERAGEIAFSVSNNASCNCASNKVLVTSAAWPQRDAFLAAVRAALDRCAPRACFYPGSPAKYGDFRAAYPAAAPVGAGADPAAAPGVAPIPYLFQTGASNNPPARAAAGRAAEVGGGGGACAGLTPKQAEHAFTNEPWCTVLSEVALPEATLPDFLAGAAAFCNERLWGTLSASVLIHPRDERRAGAAFHAFLRDMRYGLITVNAPSLAGYIIPRLTWGAFPGHTVHDVGSGLGFVRNSLLVDNAQKSVLRCPWRPPFKNLLHPDNGNAEATFGALSPFLAAPSFLGFARVAFNAVRG